jgi:hypothetical protein
MKWSEQLKLLKEQRESASEKTNEFSALNHHLSNYADKIAASAEPLEKDLIIETRSALSFCTLCLAAEDSRPLIQEAAVVQHKLHLPLCRILSSPSGDTKSRLLAGRLLSNLVTSNTKTATCVMKNDVALSPSAEEISASIKSVVSEDDTTTEAVATKCSLNWVDMMLGCARSGNRNALGATVAALHNCVAALEQEEAIEVAQNQILISTLMRQILPSSAAATAVDNNNEAADSATEWISLFLEQLCRLGLLPLVYGAIGDGGVTPEHSVLLHCVSAAVDEWLESVHSQQQHPLGNDEHLVASHVFLVQQASRIRTQTTTTIDTEFDPGPVLTKSALILISEILATSLGSDSSESMDLVRTKLGTETDVIIEAALDLGITVDALLKANHGLKARELSMSDDEQRWLTTLVRLLGNMCFRCRTTQDLLRTTLVPPVDDRTALHVLLSCTSLASGCFTLREWSIVALRNVLEGNLENQALVEKLEAQQPLQSPELEQMGLRVDMDKRGKVKIVPTPPPPPEK